MTADPEAKQGRDAARKGHLPAVLTKLFPGKFVVRVFTEYGWGGVVILLVGFGAGSFTGYEIHDWIKRLLEQSHTPKVAQIQPALLEVRKTPSPIDWAIPYQRYLEGTEDAEKRNHKIVGYITGVVDAASPESVATYEWILTSAPGFALSAYGFRLTSVPGDRTVFELLDKTMIRSEEVHFKVAGSTKGDRLLAVVSSSWIDDPATRDVLRTFTSRVQP